ncbi:MAG: magnesium-translocating P-type ATPase [Nitrososphaeria archaeon]|jgi:Mg2+-importing ATPase
MGGTEGTTSKDDSGHQHVVLSTEDSLSAPIEEVFSKLGTSKSGLTSLEAKNRLQTYGLNELAKKRRRAGFIELLIHFRSPLILILLIAGLIAGLTGDLTDATIIFSIVVVSVGLDVYQESKAENAAEALRKRVATTATVLRDNSKKEVNLSDVVPGDIIFLSAGDMVPADARLINVKDLNINQSALTGESIPVEKTEASLNAKTEELTEWNNYIFLGTSVVSGTAEAVVVETGTSTEFGKISKRITARAPPTEFERGLRRFGSMIMEITLFLVLFVFFINAFFFTNRGVLESLLFAVAIAVGLTPELLPMVLSINLSKGAIEMSKKGVIVKRLAAIQNFGNMDVLCTDKTGTLTENKLTLEQHLNLEGKEDEKVLLYLFLNSYFQSGLKSPLDNAIMKYKDIDVSSYLKIDEIPFDFFRRRLSVVVSNKGQRFLITKGAPEDIIKFSSYCEVDEKIFDLTNEFLSKIEEKNRDLSSKGFRILGVSYKKIKEEKTSYSINDEVDMVFLGFAVFLDPPKESAKESIQLLIKNHVELKILTGDNELVTKTVCEQLGFPIKRIVLGREVAEMHDDALSRVVEEANIFARVNPEQKNRIINALKNNKHVVGFIGDGINDAPSLKISDVSISVENAVDVAKESADIILLNKDLKVLNEGVLEGRKTFGNTMKYINMAISSNFGNMFSVAGSSFILEFLPMLPTQILLNNLLYSVSETTIPTDSVDKEYIERPKKLDISYIIRFMAIFGPVSSIFDFLTFFALLYLFHASISIPFSISPQYIHQFQTAWFMESFITQTLVIFLIRTRAPFYRSKPSNLLLFSSLTVIAVALIIPFTPLASPFGFAIPPPVFFLVLIMVVGSYLLSVEVIKRWFVRRYWHLLEQSVNG